jgi:hypothetical protein
MSTENSISIPKAQLDPDTRRIEEYKPKKWPKPVSYILSALTALSIAYGTKKSSAENTNTNLNNIQLGEHLTRSNFDSSITFLEKLKYIQNINNDAFFIVRVPTKYTNKNTDPYANENTDKRGAYYLITPPNAHNLIPQLIFNGKSDKEYDGTIDEKWPQIIKYTKENTQQQGKFSIKEVERNKKFEIEFITDKKELFNNGNYNLTVIAYEDWVNVNAENGERTYRNVFLEAPLGPLGINTKISKDGMVSRTVTFSPSKLSEKNRKQAGFVIFLQNNNMKDKNAKQIIATGLCRFAQLDGTKEPAYFNWDNRPIATIDYEKNAAISDEIIDLTGIIERSLYIKEAKDIKRITFNIDKNDWDDDWYDILAGKINDKLKGKAKFNINIQNYQISVEFNESLDIKENTKIFTLYEHTKKGTPDLSFGHKISNVKIEDSKNNLVYCTWNDMVRKYPNQGIARNNPTDLDSDTWVGPKDEQIIMDEFGKMKGDKDWMSETEKCDLNKDGRIDTADLAEFELAKDGRVDNYKRAKVVFETNPGSLPTEIQREIEQDLKQLQTEILRAQIDQAYQQLKAE